MKKIVYPNSKVKSFCYINSVIKNPNIIVGDYSYYDDNNEGPENFEKHVTHFYPFLGDKLIIGKFCSIAKGVEFIMNGANHHMDSISSYPFEIIDEFKGLGRGFDKRMSRGDTIIGNDVWIGQNVTILPGIHIGDGAIIGANSVVSKNVEPYTIVAGNPIKVIRKRFDDKGISFLLSLKWWDYPIEEIKKMIPLLNSPNVKDAIKKLQEYIKK